MTLSEPKTFAKLALTTTLIIIVLLLIFSYFLVMFLGPTLFFFTPEGANSSVVYEQGLPIWIFTILGFIVPVWFNFGLFFSLLWGIFAICLIAAWKFRESLHEVIEKSFIRSMKKLFGNCLFAMPIITSMILVAVIAITELQNAGGVPTGEASLPSNPFEAFFWLSYHALAEEVGFRLIPIGGFLIIYLFWVGRKNVMTLSWGQRLKLFFMAPLFPDEAKKMVGVRTVGDFGVRGGISLGEWIMIFFTSIVFGLAHYLGGWEIGKIIPASVVGLAMGLTYLLYGVQAPILLHWFFNHYLWFFDPSKEGGLQFVSKFYPNMLPIFDLIAFTIPILGVLDLLAFAILGLRKMFEAIMKRVG
ncbi:MAG: CPBP family intramembrane glutamic endopeptidase [Candidatus Bathyarchaeaceae archaeon]